MTIPLLSETFDGESTPQEECGFRTRTIGGGRCFCPLLCCLVSFLSIAAILQGLSCLLMVMKNESRFLFAWRRILFCYQWPHGFETFGWNIYEKDRGDFPHSPIIIRGINIAVTLMLVIWWPRPVENMLDYSVTKDFKLSSWSHRQMQKVRTVRFLPMWTFATSSYDRRSISSLYDPNQYSNNTKTSSVSYSRNFSLKLVWTVE